MQDINTHNLIVTFGKHKGERWTRVPVSYLQWLSNEGNGEPKEIARAELKRRGTTPKTDLELSGHAIDRASQVTDEWKEKGVHSWLTVLATEALAQADGNTEVEYKGYKFAFSYGDDYPVLKTIIKKTV